MMLVWTLALVCCSVSSENVPDITDRRFIDLCLQEHNKARSEVRPPASDMTFMSWDTGLAVMARSWARRCVFEHSSSSSRSSEHTDFSSVGENLWVGAPPSIFTVTFAVQRWVNETVDFSYNRNSCKARRQCGHYTQVVWANSFKVGCAVHVCSSGIQGTSFSSQPGANFVCNYGPAGNVVGQRPYQTDGGPCSKCGPEDGCVDQLCRHKDRDGEKDSSLGRLESVSSASDFVPVLIVRLLGLLGSITAAIAVKRFYPDVFCYE